MLFPMSHSRSRQTTAPISSLAPLPLLLLLLSSAIGGAVAGFDPVKDAECATDDTICLTSFRWCDSGGVSCKYPDGADAFVPGSPSNPYAMLYHGRTYQVTWKQAVPDVPVTIEWWLSRDLYPDLNSGLGTFEAMWSVNTSESSYTFDPLTILMGFPTAEAPNMTNWQAIAASHDLSNHLRVSQAGAGPASVSDQFLVHTGWTEQFARNVQRYDASLYEQQRRNWQIGVGAGIGIGMPLMVVCSWWMGHRLGTRAGYDLAAKVARRREAY